MEQDWAVRPEKVSIAVKLLYITWGIGLLRVIIDESLLAQMASSALSMFIGFSGFGITWLFIYTIGKGHNWARITFLVWFVIRTPFEIFQLLLSLAESPTSGLLDITLDITTIGINAVALVFLFQEPSSDWYRNMKTS